ncbi:glycosyltransferase family 4 protein [Teredinibacter purpureus]|uniref:glycosyltransferase family 4 protein n=1 Tax=Teredinibacter purpureus TaxID=2731756 RepID=UPI0005F7DEE3|nr:glycosyltransferase family 4 protein [Teredinibacter purpureus]
MTAAEYQQATNFLLPLEHSAPPLKIALLGYRSAPFVGGQGIYLKYLSKALVQIGHHVTIYSGQPYPEVPQGVTLVKVPSLDLFAAENHATALRWHHLRSLTDLSEWWTMLTGGFGEPYTFSRRIAKLLAHSDYDIIHDNQSLGFGLIELQQRGKCVVSTIHHPIHRDRETAVAAAPNWQHRLLAKRWYSFLTMQEKVVRQLKHITTVSKTSAIDINRYFNCRDNVHLIPNGIDTTLFKPLMISKKAYRLITTASSDQPVKGLTVLLRAFAIVVKQYPDAHLRIIGTLKKGGDAEQLITALQLSNHLSFRSNLSTEALAREYNKASVAVCPSLYEGFGLPAGEAMACGLPVVSSNGGALPEVVGEAGIIVEAGNSQALAEGIEQLFSNPDLAHSFSRVARQRVLEKFCWNRVAEQMTLYYHSILANP